jgi:hypothetical protein
VVDQGKDRQEALTATSFHQKFEYNFPAEIKHTAEEKLQNGKS